jgi:hypothetical protein
MRLIQAASLAIGLVVCAEAAQSPSPPARQAAATALIAGRVIDAITGSPVDEAIVSLESDANRDDRRWRRVMVEAQGRFVFPALPPGVYSITVERFGYVPGAYRRTHPRGAAGSIDLTQGQRLTDADILMWKLSSISGRVVDERGEAMAGVEVMLLPRSFVNGRPALIQTGRAYAMTDDRGDYRFGLLTAGDYVAFVPARIATVPTDIWRSQTGIFGAIAETSVLGSPRNIQLGDHVIAILNRAPVPPAPTDAAMPVYQTTYYPSTVASQDASVISVAPGEERGAVDIRLAAVPSFRVSGRIAGPYGPVGGASLRLMPAGTIVRQDGATFSAASGVTEADGRFTLIGVPRGQYELRLLWEPPGSESSESRRPLWVAESVTVGESDVSGLPITAQPLPMIRGRIEIRGNRRPPPETFTIIIEATDPGPVRVANPRLDKNYEFATGVRPGHYTITATGPDIWCTGTTAGARNIAVDPMEVRTDDIANVVISCGGEPTRLSGTVRNERGELAGDAAIVVFSTDRRHWTALARPMRFQRGRSTPAGTFSLVNLPAGEYFVVALPDSTSEDWLSPASLDALAREATRVTLGTGQSQSVELRLVRR